MYFNDKSGSLQISAGAIALVLLVVGGAWLLYGGTPSLPTQNTAGDTCELQHELKIDGESTGLNVKELNDNQWQIKVVNSSVDLSSPISFDATTSRLDDCRTSEGTFLETVIEYENEAFEFDNADDSSDSTTYYTLSYVNDDDQYNATVDGVSFATVNRVQDTVQRGTDATATYTLDTTDAATLDKLVEDDYDEDSIFRSEIVDSEGRAIGTVDVVFVQE